jgi:hypothetical protein
MIVKPKRYQSDAKNNVLEIFRYVTGYWSGGIQQLAPLASK